MRLISFISAFLLSVFVLTADSYANLPSSLSFTVLRNGDPIGKHEYTFKESGARTFVDIVTDIKVKIAFITAYRFEHEAKEEWFKDKLIKTSSKTNDDGDDHFLRVTKTKSALNIVGDGKESTAEYGIMPASLWNPETIKHTSLLNTLDGHIMSVNVDDLGTEDVPVKGEMVKAQHYRLSGDLERELWFDDRGLLVQVSFKGDDGSDISYVLH